MATSLFTHVIFPDTSAYDSSSGVQSPGVCKINIKHGMGDIHCLFSLDVYILHSHIIGVKSQSCKLNQFLRVLTKENKVLWNKLRCLLYPQSPH